MKFRWLVLCALCAGLLAGTFHARAQFTRPIGTKPAAGGGGGGGYTLVATGHATVPGNGAGPVTITSSALDTTGATLLILITGSHTSAGNSPSDARTGCASPCNTWLLAVTDGSGTNGGIFIHYAIPTSGKVGPNHTFSNSTNYAGMIVMSFTGVPSPVKDQTNFAFAGYSVTTGQPGPVTPTSSGQLVVSGIMSDSTTTTVTLSSIDSGMVIVDTLAAVNLQQGLLSSAWKPGQPASLINPTWTFSAAAAAGYDAAIATFK